MPTNNSCDYSPTQYNVQTGGANGTLNNVAPSATSGVPLISQGSSSQAIFGTVVVAGGGTGAVSLTGILTGNGTSAVTASAVTQYDILVGGASSAVSSVGPGSAGQVLQSGGNAANPVYSTSTYPATNAINTLLYASSANTMAALATADNGVLITSATGVPSWLADGTTGQVLTATTGSPPAWASSSGGSSTWTPVLSFGGTTTGITYGTQIGKYYTIGSLIFFDIYIVLTAKGSAGGAAQITLPVAAASDSHYLEHAIAIGNPASFPSGCTQIYGNTSPGSTTYFLYGQGAATTANLAVANFNNTSAIQATGFYWTA